MAAEPADQVDLTRTRAFGQASDMRVDWFRLLVQLKQEGYSFYDIAHFTGIAKSSLIGYKQGSQPSYHQGVLLLEFWSQAIGCAPDRAPMVNRFSFMA